MPPPSATRPRTSSSGRGPFLIEPRLSPVVSKPPTYSYPSGHSSWALVCGIVLADMIPERRAQIFARADEYAHNRNVGGRALPE